jgi:hypothetical protein
MGREDGRIAILECQISKHFGVHAVNDISISLDQARSSG